MLVPTFLRPHIMPSIRRVYIDQPEATLPKPPASLAAECGRVTAENSALRIHCEIWRRRAEIHSAANLGLLGLARLARDHAMQMKRERDDLEVKYQTLKRKYHSEEECVSFSPFERIKLTRFKGIVSVVFSPTSAASQAHTRTKPHPPPSRSSIYTPTATIPSSVTNLFRHECRAPRAIIETQENDCRLHCINRIKIFS